MPESQLAPQNYIPEVSYQELIGKEYNYRITIEDIIYCIDVLKLNQKQTADRLNCHESNISQRLKAYGYKRGDLDKFKNHDADRYSIRRMRIAKHLTDDKLEKMSAYQLTGMDSMTLQNERLIRGESTENIAYIDKVKQQEIIAARLDSFDSKYGLTDDMINITPNK